MLTLGGLIVTTTDIVNSKKETIVDDLVKLYNDLEGDKKYYVILHSLYDCNIFKYFRTKSHILKQVNYRV